MTFDPYRSEWDAVIVLLFAAWVLALLAMLAYDVGYAIGYL